MSMSNRWWRGFIKEYRVCSVCQNNIKSIEEAKRMVMAKNGYPAHKKCVSNQEK